MKIVIALLAALTLPLLPAQSHGYVFSGAGGFSSDGLTSGAAWMGIGGNGVLDHGIGIGAEAGFMGPWRDLRYGIGIGSVNGSWYFRRRGAVLPFVTGGYSVYVRNGATSGFNAGGGVDWWFQPRLGLKVEIRDHSGAGNMRGTHLWAIRAGLIFR